MSPRLDVPRATYAARSPVERAPPRQIRVEKLESMSTVKEVLDAWSFSAELEALERAFETREENPSSVELHGCKNCVECTFCKASRALLRCHYCVDSERCVLSTHCRSSRDLYAANHCVAGERCSHSSYLVR